MGYAEQIARGDGPGDGNQAQRVVFAEIHIADFHADEVFGDREFEDVGAIVDLHGFGAGAEGEFVYEVVGRALFGGQYAVDVEAFEYGVVEFVHGTCIYVWHVQLLEQGHRLDACAEVFADGHYDYVDIFERQYRKGHLVGRIYDVGSGYVVLDALDKRRLYVSTDDFMADSRKVGGEIVAVYSESDDKKSPLYYGVVKVS